MRYMMRYLIPAMILVLALGCQEKPIGGDHDSHGCLIGGGYSWCETKQKCLRTWEEPCEEIAQDCKTGLSWCEAEGECLREWKCSATEDEKDAAALASQEIQMLPEFTDYALGEPEVLDVTHGECGTCFAVELTYQAASMKDASVTEEVMATVIITNGTVVEMVSSSGPPVDCESMGGHLATEVSCAEGEETVFADDGACCIPSV